MNVTQREDGQWRALKNDQIIKSTKYLGSVYDSELASELQKLGYKLRFEKNGQFELAHIDRKQIEGMSTRRQQIISALEEKGLSVETASTGQKQHATMQTRSKKEKDIDRKDLFNEWKSRANELNIDFDRKDWIGAGAQHSNKNIIKEISTANEAKKAIKYALNHHTERQSVIDRATLIDTALKHSLGRVTINDISKEINIQKKSGFLVQELPLYTPAGSLPSDKDQSKTRADWIKDLTDRGFKKSSAREKVDQAIQQGGLIPGEIRYTTQTAIERENSILKSEREGRAAVSPIMNIAAAAEHLSKSNLNAGQLEAAQLIATTNDRIIGVQGFAGVGKSHMLSTAIEMIEGESFNVRALAPYSMQVEALRELGVQANTLASFLKAKDKGINEKTVLVIDEAGTIPTRQMQQLFKIAEKYGARITLMGDTAQTKAIEAGRPFDQLQNAGMKTAHIKEIQRQKDPRLKRAVSLAAQGKTDISLHYIKDVIEIEDHSQRRRAIAETYTNLNDQDREKTIIVSGTNEARKEINKHVRELLNLDGKGIEVNMLIRQDTTQAERKFSKNYSRGDLIQPEKDYKNGLNRGELYKVIDTGPGNRLTVESKENEIIQYNPMTHTKISVYKSEKSEVSKGDLVRITRNDAHLDIANGDRFTVAEVTTEKTILKNKDREIELPNNAPLHIGHAYATTVHSSQGLTSDRVIIDANTQSKTTAKDVYYVAVSRAKFVSQIFTDNSKNLPKSIMKDNVKFNAHDLALKNKNTGIDKNRSSNQEIQKEQVRQGGYDLEM